MMNKHDVHTLIALRVLQNEENDVFAEEGSKENRKNTAAKLERKRESILDAIDLSEAEIDIIKDKRKKSQQALDAQNAKFAKMKERADKHAASFKSKPKIKTPD